MNADIINQLGFQFDNSFNVEGRLSISDLFPKSKPRCGIYLLYFSNGTYYIGQALNNVRRFSQHQKNHSDIALYWFQAVEKAKLDSVEQKLIREAEKHGLLLTNKTFVSNIIGETDLDFVLSQQEQVSWLSTSLRTAFIYNNLFATVSDKFKLKYRQKFLKLSSSPDYGQIRLLLKTYFSFGIPNPSDTQLSFWSLSCLPSNSTSYIRNFCLNINAMEVFVTGIEKNSKNPFGFFVASSSILTKSELALLRNKYPSLETYNRNYRAAGADQVTLDFTNLVELRDCLQRESIVQDAIKHLNLRLMRKGGTIYSPYHCFDLANDVLT